ncbi:MAG: hypothetical protein IH939_08305 [Acidobacteria bacterium]|nr:hypothetical protein [Acidobacteriota bacterium]
MRVLIVDDDRDSRDLLRRLVGKQGHPTEGEALYAAHGRGMMLSRLYFDSRWSIRGWASSCVS